MSKKKDSLKPWLSRPTVNRSVTLPLTRPLTQRLSNLNEFHPNELDPYLLFDAQDSMIGTLENPTLDLDPSNPDTLNVITATRAGGATFTDVNGLIATAPANTVRVDHVDGVPMILVEPSATNLMEYSEAIGSNSFSKVGTTIDSNVTVSPDGTASADLLKADNSNGSHFMFKDLTLSSGQAYTISVYAKRNGVDRDLRFGDGGLGWSSGFTSNFDLTEGTATGGGTIESIGNDWYRCSVTGTTNATTARLIVYSTLNAATSYQGDGESGIYLWGFQIEAGSVVTSYIPTAGGSDAARTRAADDLVISGSAFSNFYNQSEGTIYTEVVPNSSGVYFWSINDGGAANRIFSFYDISDNINHYVISGGTTYFVDDIPASAPSAISRSAISYKTNNVIHSVNGTNSSTDTSVTLPSGLNKLSLGQTALSQSTLNGHIKRLIYWPYHSDSL